jgi:predicted ATPase/DNA-binding SARP family transcriptional activator
VTRNVAVSLALLGPLQLEVDGHPVAVPGPKRRAVLALLALAEGRAVSVDALLDAVWPDEVPATGRRALHAHISRLRGHLGPAADRLERVGATYRLRLDDDGFDVVRARRLAEAGQRRLAADPVEAQALLEEARSLWRGPALEELPDVAPLAAEAVALEELRAEIVDDLLDAGLATRGPGVLQHAMAAAGAAPRRERTHLLLMRALALAGRSAEALEVAHQFRRRLAEEAGLDPSPALAEVEQAVAAGTLGGPADASPARPSRPSGKASSAPTSLIGRALELDRLEQLVRAERLITVLGAGGVGKTTLARDALDRLPDERELIVLDLGAVTTVEDVLGAFATALRLSTAQDVDVVDRAADRLGLGAPVVLLDSCEHLLDPCRALVSALLPRCPALTVVATSRERLGLASERVLRMGPLPLPDPDEDRPEVVAANPAVQAFVAHAARSGGVEIDADTAPIVADVVRRLDGLPLALELAAGRVGALGLAGLRDSLDQSLDLLGRPDGDPRHQTLRRAVEWSYRLLSDEDRTLFRALGSFPGGIELAALRHATTALGLSDDPALVLARLVDASMLTADADLVARYTMLETIRSLARQEQVAAGEQEQAEQVLLDWGSEVARRVGRDFGTRADAAVDRLIRRELPNLRAARAVARRRGSIEGMVEAVLLLSEPAQQRDLPELGAWTIDLATSPLVAAHPQRGELLGAAANASWMRGDLAGATRLAEEGLATAEGEARRWSLDALGAVRLFEADTLAAEQLWVEAATYVPVPHYLASAALAAGYRGEVDHALSLLGPSFARATELESDSYLSYCHYVRAEVMAPVHPEEARQDYTTAIELAQRVGASFVGSLASVGLVSLLAREGDVREALTGFRWLLRYFSRSGNWTQQWTTVRNLAALLAQHGEAEVAALLLRCADAAAEGAAIAVEQRPAYDALRAELDAALGTEGRRRVDRLAMTTGRVAAVRAAIEAIDRALATV